MQQGKTQIMASVIFKRPPIKKLKKDGLFGVDLHFHTQYSLDAISRISNAVKKAEKKGFGFAITDHNTVKGVMASYKIRRHALIIPGIEVTCNNGNHVLAYFYSHNELEEFFNKTMKPRMSNPFYVNASVAQVLELSKRYNCIIGAPHPYAPGAVSMMNSGVSEKVEKGLDTIEVLNGFNLRSRNMKALYWASRLDKSMTGGSDGHSTIHLGKVLTFTQGHDIESIFKDILKKKSIVIGKENGLLVKALMTIRKDKTYISNCKKMHLAKKLIKTQWDLEYSYFRNRFNRHKADKMIREHQKDMNQVR